MPIPIPQSTALLVRVIGTTMLPDVTTVVDSVLVRVCVLGLDSVVLLTKSHVKESSVASLGPKTVTVLVKVVVRSPVNSSDPQPIKMLPKVADAELMVYAPLWIHGVSSSPVL